ncbi:MAG: AAA family ATPase [Synergistaceae bacterium]|nr:AAA family ATPase [Synergistaceae bacterium]
MKILNITLKNLNSLRGEWYINLEDNAYTTEGIFAVTGPTGAGKTTIFDAVCLALYGQTPRLKKVTSTTNEIMSKGTGECYAYVTFSTEAGKFTCKWGQHRKGLEFDGKLQKIDHQIFDESGTPLTHNAEDTPGKVDELTGMDFTRFTRAMMLEQGGFDAFLDAGKNERAEILELITGTSIYSDISRRVFARCRLERDSLANKKSKLDGLKESYDGMSEDAITSEIEQLNAEIARLRAAHDDTASARDILREIKNLSVDLARTQDDISIHEKRIEAFTAERRRMDSAERAAEIEPDYTRLMSARSTKAKCESECRRMQESIGRDESSLARYAEVIPKMTDELSRLRGSIPDSPDVVVMRVKSAIDEYTKAEEDYKQSEAQLQAAEARLKKAQAESMKRVEAGKTVRAKLNEAEQNHRRVFDEIMSTRARTTAAVLDEERAKLRPGTPCPLCGSPEHPGVVHGESAHEEAEALFRRSEKLQADMDRLGEIVQSAKSSLDRAIENWNKAYAEEQTAANEASRLREEKSADAEKLSSCRIAVSEAIYPLGLAGTRGTGEVLRKTQEWAERVRQLEERIQSSQNETARLGSVIAAAKDNLSLKNDELSALGRELSELEALFRDKLTAKNFTDESDFASSLQYVSELPGLRQRWQELTDGTNKLAGKLEDIQRRLDEKKAQDTSSGTFEEMDALFRKQEAGIIAVSSKIASLTQKLENVRTLQAKIAELEKECASQKDIADNWAALNSLIGSAEGDKFRVFAQKVTLELVVNNANDYLQKMNGRYVLVLPPESKDLKLSVKDNEQQGEIRPTDNLSGGERFLISLALALGLSQISGSKARVDSLFLDEGFGSLDEDSLHTALEALGEVRREGRMIGIISHVSALRERIAAQIRVIPQSEGVSVIEGPGCSRE